MKKKDKLFPLYLTIFNDCISWGIVLTIFAPMLLDTQNPILPENTSVHIRTILIGLLLAIFGFGQLFSCPILGAISDQVGRKKVLIFTLLASSASNALSAFAIYGDSITLLFISRLLAGCFSGNLPLAQASIGDLSTEETKAKNMSKVNIIGGISWIIGPPFGGLLSDPKLVSWFNFAIPMWLLTALFALNAYLIIFYFKETYTKGAGKGWKEEIRDLQFCFREKIYRIPLLTMFLFLLGWFFFLLFYPTLLVQKFHYEQAEIGFLSGYLSIFFMIGALLVMYWFSKIYKPQNMIFIPILIAGVFILITLTFPDALYYLITFPFLAIGGSIGWTNFMAYLSNLAGEKNQGKIFGVQQSLQSFALFLSPFVSGFIGARHHAFPLAFGGVLILISAFLYYGFFLKSKKAT